MINYVTGGTIKALREKKGYTQKQLSELLVVSDKTISKWETGKGLPDISLIEPLSAALGVSVAELLSGEYVVNRNRSGNLKKSCLYVCPLCGNVIHAVGNATICCCGISLPALTGEEAVETHDFTVEQIEYDYYVTMDHPMTRDHYISFFAYVTANRVQMVKLYPEQNAEARFPIVGRGGVLYAYCNQHGLFYRKIS